MEFKIIDQAKREKFLNILGAKIIENAMSKVPKDEGSLAKHLSWKVEGNTLSIFTFGIDYAEDMEYGKPAMKMDESEKKDIDDWAHRHGLKSGAGVAKHIEKYGIKVGANKTVESPTIGLSKTAAVDSPAHITSLGRDSYRPFLRPAVFEETSNTKLKEALAKALK